MNNPFRNPLLRHQYANAIAAYQSKNKFLFHDGQPHRRNSWAANFWAGFNGVDGGLFRPNDPAYRRSPSYAMYRAGADCANNEKTELRMAIHSREDAENNSKLLAHILTHKWGIAKIVREQIENTIEYEEDQWPACVY